MNLRTYAVAFDSSDALELARFWSRALGRPVDPDGTPDFASIGLTGDGSTAPRLMFAKVPEAKTVKNRVHLDLVTDSLDEEVDRLLGLGARKRDEHDEGGARWVTLADPQGNEFDVLAGQ
jgi:hypothetical protein